ncbi:hypothetical protein MLD38_035504 [Melastoma candidum]|uniref:Uncharacterized protein n=1 Tax=Melastoma candidum TaxID=119954 RepID=A0ACB9LGT1_9MYRT|nr:hypothetical protein MLD38_035504 [Melastoma candidum]
MKKSILTSCAGGNSGPTEYTIENVAPWITTVAASSTNRKFVTKVKLGNGLTLSGSSINTFSPKKTMYPLTSGSKAANSTTYGNASVCDDGSLSEDMVKGRVVYCWDYSGQDYTSKFGRSWID